MLDRSLLITAGYDHQIKFWNLLKGQMLLNISHAEGQVNSMCLSPNSRHLAVAAWQKLRIYDINALYANRKTSDPIASFDLPKNVTVVGFEMHGRWMFSGGDDKCCRVFELKTNQLVCQRTQLFRAGITSIEMHVNQVELFIATTDGEVYVWDLRREVSDRMPMPLLEVGEWVQKLSIHPGGILLSAITNNGRLFTWDVKIRALEHVMEPGIGSPTATTASTGIIREGDEEPRKVQNGYGLSCRYSPCAKYLITTGSDSEIHMFDAETAEHLRTMNNRSTWNWDAIYAPDGRHVFTGGDDCKVHVYETVSGEHVAAFSDHQKPITAMCTNLILE